MEDRLLKLTEAARLLSVTPQTLRKWDNSGKLPCIRTPSNQRRVRLSDVQRLISGGSDEKQTLV